MRRMKRLLPMVLLCVACSGSGDSAIVGDWFQCSTISCEALVSGGTRFRSDGTWVLLAAKGATLDDNEEYCLKHDPKAQGIYSWDGKILKTTAVGDSSATEVGFEVNGSEATRTNLSTSSYAKLREISDPRSSGYCGTPSTGDAGTDAGPADAKANDGLPPVVLDSTPYFPDF